MFETLIPFHARRQPEAIALRTEDRAISYARFDRAIDSFAAALETEGWRAGEVALVQHRDPVIRWLIALALERLNLTFVLSVGTLASRVALLKPGIVITDSPPEAADIAAPIVVIDAAWVDAALAGKGRPTLARSHDADDVITLITSSGTTGTPKVIALSRKIVDRRLTVFNLLQPDQARALAVVGEDTSVGVLTPMTAWWQGGEAAVVHRVGGDMLVRLRPSILSVSPSYLDLMVNRFPEVFTALKDMVVDVMGGAIGPALARKLEDLKGARVTISYGSTEASVIAHGPASLLARHPGAGGYVVPWAQVQIVRPDGGEAPPGEIGEVRIRSDCMVDRYRGDPEATAAKFKDGWFHPGDLGRFTEDGLLVIAGRIDDVMNIGGLKLSTARMEETVLECEGVEDGAVAAFPMTGGRWTLCCAVTPTSGFDPERLVAVMTSTFKVQPMVVTLDAIPRNRMHKVQRDLLRDAILAKINGPAAKAPRG